MENVAVIGASPNPDRYSNKAIRLLEKHNHHPIPVALKHETIEDRKVYRRLNEITEKVDTVTMYVGPKKQGSIIDEILELAPKRVIFNPDTEDSETREKLEKAGIKVVEACTLVLLKTGQF
jgi:hypothetical protein